MNILPCIASQRDLARSRREAELDDWEDSVDALALELEEDTLKCRNSFVGLLNEIAEDCSVETLDCLWLACTATNYDLMGRAFADCLRESCHKCAVDSTPKPPVRIYGFN